MPNNNPQDQAEPCLAVAALREDVDNGANNGYEQRAYPTTDTELLSAGDLFLDQRDINPRRRIVRARRPSPPPNNVSSSSMAANGGGDNDADVASGSGGDNVSVSDEEGGNNHDGNNTTNAAVARSSYDDDRADVSNELRLTSQQLNDLYHTASGTNGAFAVEEYNGESNAAVARTAYDDHGANVSNEIRSNSQQYNDLQSTTSSSDTFTSEECDGELGFDVVMRSGSNAESNYVNPLRREYHEEDHGDDDDDDDGDYDYNGEQAEDSDDDDGSLFGAPSQFFEGFLSHMNEMARRNSSAIRAPRQYLSSKIRPDEDDDEESDYDDDEHDNSTDVRCAACYRSDNQIHKWRRLVTLPCCGTNGREANSSTRFCAACILKLAVTRPSASTSSEYHRYDDEPDEYPVRKFYEKNIQKENKRFCECPRCRDILLVKIKGVQPADGDDSDEDSSDNECDCSDCVANRRDRAPRESFKTATSVSVHVPSFRAKCWHIGRKRGVAKLLWKVALLHHNFMPFEALGGEEEKGTILRLTGWGIIEKVPGKSNANVYRMDRGDQTKLIKIFRLKDPSDKDQKSECLLMSDVGPCLLIAAWKHLRDEYRIDRSLRMLNRFSFIGLHFFGYLPPLPLSWRQELVVTSFILFSATLAAQFLCVLLVYAAAFFGVGLSVCYVLKRINNVRSCWWQVIILSYFAYRLNKWFYESPYLSWCVLVSPKAMILVKKLLWGG